MTNPSDALELTVKVTRQLLAEADPVALKALLVADFEALVDKALERYAK